LIEAVVGGLDESAADPEVQPSTAQEIHQSVVLGQPDRIMMWQQNDRGTDAKFGRALGNCGGNYLRRGTNVAAKVMLADPDRIEAQLFRVAYLLEEILVVLLLRTILGVVIE
jgi:hypothetical protein